MATSLICVGGQLTFKRMKLAFKRGFVLFMSKFLGGLVVCILWLTLFGERGVFGISILALACVLTNQNNSLFIGQMTDYGDEKDLASAAVTALISTTMTTIIAMAMLGLTELNTNSLIDIFIPITSGFTLANLDESVSDFFGKTQYYMLPFMGFVLGSSINLMNIFKGGISEIILGLTTIVTGIIFMLPADRKISKRPGYAAIAMATTECNAVATPNIIASFDKTLAPHLEITTTQIAASVVLTAILIPILTEWWIKRKKPKAN